MNKTFEKLENLLKKDERFVSQEGKLIRNAVYEASNKMDEKLLMLLMSDEKIKEIFFTKVNNIYVYDKQKFNFVINNRQMLPDSYTRYKQDIGLMNSKDEYISATNDVVLSFPFKDCVLEFDSTDPDQKREEIFFNEILAHDEIDHLFSNKVLTNAKLVEKDGEEKTNEFNDESNMLIKGNNLLAMYSLLPRYKGKVKLMYWDILYNADNDQVPYADRFKHSSWLVMMKNRLEIAKALLKEEGIIAIHCDATEMHYLKVLMDEIFERKNYVSTITCKIKSSGGLTAGTEMFFDCSEYIIVYSKTESVEFNSLRIEVEKIDKDCKTVGNYNSIIYDVDYSKKEFICEKDNFKWYRLKNDAYKIEKLDIAYMSEKDFYDNRDIIFRLTALSGGIGKKIKKHIKEIENNDDMLVYEYVPKKGRDKGKLCQYLLYKKSKVSMLKNYLNIDDENKVIYKTEDISNIFTNDWWQGISKEGNVKLNNGKKPEILLKTLLDVCTNKGDIVLDAYFGTGTTGAVAMKMGRKFIGIEQLDSHIELAKTRLKNVINGDETGISKIVDWKGGGSFVYCELKKLNEQFIEDIKHANTKAELSLICIRIGETGFVSCYANMNKLNEILRDVDEFDVESFKKLLIEVLDKNQLYVNCEDINDIDFRVSDEDKKFTESFYDIK